MLRIHTTQGRFVNSISARAFMFDVAPKSVFVIGHGLGGRFSFACRNSLSYREMLHTNL